MKPSVSPNPGQENTDASLRLIGTMAAVLVLGVGASLIAARAIVKTGRPVSEQAGGLNRRGDFANGPDERTGIAQAWSDLAAQTQQHLQTYGWVDRPAGIVRIPIDRAMDLMAARAISSGPNSEGKPAP